MLVSIIIPSYNQAELLEQALLSIEMQDFKDYEIIIADANSTDNTRNIISKFNHLPISLYSELDNGIYDAMNKGIHHSKGEFVYFMGCDDKLFSKDVLSKVFADKSHHKLDVIYGNVVFSDSGFVYNGRYSFSKLFDVNICHQAIFVRKSVFSKVGMFNVRYKAYADWEHNMRWFSNKSIKKAYIPISIALYNTSGFSSHMKDDNFFKDEYELKRKYFPWFVFYLKNNINRPIHYRMLNFVKLIGY